MSTSPNLGLTYLTAGQLQPDVTVNNDLNILDAAAGLALQAFSNNPATTTGLTYGYFGGKIYSNGANIAIANGTIALAASVTNYVQRTAAGVVSVNTTGFTAGLIPMAQVTTGASTVTTIADARPASSDLRGRQVIAVAATNITLTDAQMNARILSFQGTLTANVVVTFPAYQQEWIVSNETTGAFSLQVQTSGGLAQTVPQGIAAPFYGNGTNVVPAAPLWTNGFKNYLINGDFAINQRGFVGGDIGGVVTGTTITAGGSGYTSAPTVAFAAPPAGGTQATGTAVITSGAVTSITINNPGAGYTAAPAITFSGGGGTGATATCTVSSTTGIYAFDRWKSGSSVCSISLSGDVLTHTSGPLVQVIESPNLAGKTITVSVDALTGGNLTVNVEGVIGTIVAGSGRVGVSLAVPSGSTGNVTLTLTPASGAVTYKRVQVELGSVATAFEWRPAQVEIEICQRYFWKTFPMGTAPVQNSGVFKGAIAYIASFSGAGYVGQHVAYPTLMPASPTVTFFNPQAANANWRNRGAGADSGAASLAYAESGDNSANIVNFQGAADATGQTIYVHATFDSEL